MKSLKLKFEKIVLKYNSKKDFFKKTISGWQLKGRTDQYLQATIFTKNIESLINEINNSFLLYPSEKDNKNLKTNIKTLKNNYKQLNEMTKNFLRQWLEAIIVAGSFVFILRTFLFGLYHVPTGSAEPTILVGDRIWGNKVIYFFKNINRGDCVIFDNPEFNFDKLNHLNYLWQKYAGIPIPLLGLGNGPDNWVKRVIAIPGDTIEGRIENGRTSIYLNGQKLDETIYVNPYPLIKLAKLTGFIDLEYFGPFRLPSFLTQNIRLVDYTYDPSENFDKQPFYSMREEEVIKKHDGSPILRMPYFPTYEYDRESGQVTDRSVDNFGPIKVPAGKYWVMGDSRKNSKDSRYWGFLDENLIHGRASFIIYSIDSEEPLWIFDLLKHPIDFWTKLLRLNRSFKNIK